MKAKLSFRLRLLLALIGLAGRIAHDFNKILTPIMARREMALMQLTHGNPVSEDVSHVLRAAKRAAALVKEILTLSRKEGTEALIPVNVAPLLKEMVNFLRASIPSTLEIRVDLEPDCCPVLADPSQLHQVRLNLCTNASYAMAHQGGVLVVPPGMTGLALTTKMLRTRPDLPIVPGTGMADGLTEKVVHDTRLRGLLRKPFSVQSLSLALQQALHSAPTSSSVAGTPSL